MSSFKTFVVVLLLTLSTSAALAVTAYQEITVTVSSTSGEPSVPAVAQAAGFTTLAFNLDFTGQTSDGTHPANWYQTLPNWFTCNGAGSYTATSMVLVEQKGPAQSSFFPPCSDFSVVSDGSFDALLVQWTAADWNNQNNSSANVGAGVWMATCSDDGTLCGQDHPITSYIEVTDRVSPQTLTAYSGLQNGNQFIVFDDWSWPTNGFGASAEIDFIEMTNNYGYNDGINWSGTGWPGGIDVTQYTTWGYLVTSNGSSDIVGCDFLNGSLVNCVDLGANGLYNGRNSFISQVGPGGTQYSASGTNIAFGPPGATFQHYTQSIRIWTCSGWITGSCFGSSQSNNGGLIYWHN